MPELRSAAMPWTSAPRPMPAAARPPSPTAATVRRAALSTRSRRSAVGPNSRPPTRRSGALRPTDGIPDYYETLLGLDPNDASDADATTLDPQGIYPNIEVYFHFLVREISAAQTVGGNYTALE